MEKEKSILASFRPLAIVVIGAYIAVGIGGIKMYKLRYCCFLMLMNYVAICKRNPGYSCSQKGRLLHMRWHRKCIAPADDSSCGWHDDRVNVYGCRTRFRPS